MHVIIFHIRHFNSFPKHLLHVLLFLLLVITLCLFHFDRRVLEQALEPVHVNAFVLATEAVRLFRFLEEIVLQDVIDDCEKGQ